MTWLTRVCGLRLIGQRRAAHTATQRRDDRRSVPRLTAELGPSGGASASSSRLSDCLLVYGNATDLDASAAVLPPRVSGRVLVTSRARLPRLPTVEVSVFDRAESVALLHHHLPDLPLAHMAAMGERQAVRELAKDTLARQWRILGTTNLGTLRSANLAIHLRERGEHQAAQE